ncbi:hypothetical protein [Propionispora vibrioides]|uniref:Uncharacterized protein n=1 Tax=Propionispora vibrioides TaxID=112903 RepID=A0A1H8XYU3_9FIRM|nr:hypothetical protein [Propionispora vibrioides]SEP45049.1 hypothetical protein SAMN04490178_13411 [Propionispora vibrioides]
MVVAVASDINDVLRVFVFGNLSSIVNNEPVVVPAGIDILLQVNVLNNMGALGLPPDIAQITENYFVAGAGSQITAT